MYPGRHGLKQNRPIYYVYPPLGYDSQDETGTPEPKNELFFQQDLSVTLLGVPYNGVKG